MNIGKAIKEIRKEVGMTQNDLSAISGISQTSISLLEEGKRQVRRDNLLTLASAMNVSPAKIYIVAIEISDLKESKRKEPYAVEMFEQTRQLLLKTL